ncbi:GIY-YIG nuclease family protein [Sphaerisporangium sp. NPDC004334]
MTSTQQSDTAVAPVLVSTREAAEDLGVPDWVIRKWASDGRLPPHGTRGRETLYRLDDVINAETNRRKAVSVERLEHLPLQPPSHGMCTGGDLCPEPAVMGAPAVLCRAHLLACLEFVYNARAEYKATIRRLEQRTATPDEDKRLAAAGHRDVVYILRFGDRIKIGYSANFRRRMSEVPYDELLLVLPGTRAHESALHEIFKEHRISGEWFHPHEDILKFVAEHTHDGDQAT